MIGSNIIELERVGSTNEYASDLLNRRNPAEGTIIWALEQFKGKGQNDNCWNSEPGKNLTFTLILKPRFLPPDHQFLLNKVISLGVVDYVNHRLTSAMPDAGCQMPDPTSHIPHPTSHIPHPISHIKWPNDIYVGRCKLGGILITHRIMGAVIDTSIIGIGLNLNQMTFPPDLPNAVSLKQILNIETDLRGALQEICLFLESRYNSLLRSDITVIEKDYREALLGFGEWREYSVGKSHFEGSVIGVDDLGRLLVETRTHELKAFNHKEIEIIL